MGKSLTKDDFIAKAKKIHGETYKYNNVDYVNSHTKVCIVCTIHGAFWQTPNSHLRGRGCPKCGGTYHYTTEEWVEEAKKVHGNKYDYSKVCYKNNKTKVCIICKTHGAFFMTPNMHIQGCKCPKCAGRHNYMTKEWIEEAKKVHKNKFVYDKVKYINNKTTVCIICKKHGEFWQVPNSHLQGYGCPKCSGKYHYTTEDWINEAKKIHGDKYDYSKVNYIDVKTNVSIICPIHGEFWQNPYVHLKGHQCPRCVHKSNAYTTEEWIEEAKKVHDNKYDYSKVYYKNNKTKVCIICKNHGEFWQTPHNHLIGNGCPECNTSKLEQTIKKLLKENNIEFEEQKHFEWLGRQSLDFYLPKLNIAIECQGMQHFETIEYFGGNQKFIENIKRDNRKRVLCNENTVKLLYYANYEYEFPYKVYTDKNKLLEEIKNE